MALIFVLNIKKYLSFFVIQLKLCTSIQNEHLVCCNMEVLIAGLGVIYHAFILRLYIVKVAGDYKVVSWPSNLHTLLINLHSLCVFKGISQRKKWSQILIEKYF